MVFTSVVLFLGESVLALAFFVGVAWCVRWAVPRAWMFKLSGVTDAGLVRFCWFQIVFLASWSVLFKIALYAVVPSATGDLSRGYSFFYANAAEEVIIALVLVGLVLLAGGALKRVRHA